MHQTHQREFKTPSLKFRSKWREYEDEATLRGKMKEEGEKKETGLLSFLSILQENFHFLTAHFASKVSEKNSCVTCKTL